MRRAWLFACDLVEELRCAWGIARYRDCGRRGHLWRPPGPDDVLGWSRTCARCGCDETVSQTAATVASGPSTMVIDVGGGTGR